MKAAATKKNVKSADRALQAPVMFRTANDLPKPARVKLIALLNARSADTIDLHTQMKQAHWNVKGPNFIRLHELFDKIHASTDGYVDTIAERAVQLGGVAEGTVRSSAKRTHIPEYLHGIADGAAHVDAVTAALAAFGHEVRESIDQADDLEDADTADIFTEVSRGIDKWLWFMEAHAQAAK